MSSHNKKEIALIFSTIFLVVFALIAYFFQGASAQSINQTKSLALDVGNVPNANYDGGQKENDAIGVRIIPNPNHYSVYRWYESQGFTGSPQALTVDGYEALRDGRTVYINAAQVVPESKTIYTNIYLISYNQDPNVKTIDILGQIISRWKFNDNLSTQETAYCSISVVKCEQDSDCLSNQTCSLTTGTCALKEPKVCTVDENCPANFFCDSVKAKIIRDLKRVGKIEELREALAKYRQANGRYPLLEAGTYLPGVSTSLWPSWNEAFLSTLRLNQGFVDPINRLGVCPGFDPKTCWNKDTKKFFSNLNYLTLQLPYNSHALVYTTNSSGSEYNICATLESRDTTNPSLGYSFFPNNPISSACAVSGVAFSGNANNSPPQITNVSLQGVSGQEYNGFIQAFDPDGDPLVWDIEGVTFSWPNWVGAPPILKSTSDPNQKKLFALKAGDPGKYYLKVSVSDSLGLSVGTTTEIVISETNFFSQVSDYTYRLDPVIPFDFNFYIYGGASAPSYTLTRVSGPDILAYAGISKTEVNEGANNLRVNYKGVISTSVNFSQDVEAVYRLNVGSGSPDTAKNFSVKIIVEKPALNFNCPLEARYDKAYSCYLGALNQGNFTLSYSSMNVLPASLQISEVEPSTAATSTDPITKATASNALDYTVYSNDGWVPLPMPVPILNKLISGAYLHGTAYQSATNPQITISVRNDYQVTNTKSFPLKVNTYCGDGIRQTPNTEGKGGVFNDGRESCDGVSGTTNSPIISNKNLQYGCKTGPGEKTPYPITSNNYCIYKSPLDGGGYCGDTYCQLKINNVNYENKDNCPFDCDPNYFGPPPNLDDGEEIIIDCSQGLSCPTGYFCDDGSCEPRCWQVEETTKSILVREGDATRANVSYEFVSGWLNGSWDSVQYSPQQLPGCGEDVQTVKYCNYGDANLFGCSLVKIDDPACNDGFLNINNCPVGCDSFYVSAGVTGSGDKCKGRSSNNWRERKKMTCYGNETITRCFQDPCRATPGSTVINGTINEFGNCVNNKTVPEDPTGPSNLECYSDFDCPIGEVCIGDYGQCIGEQNYIYCGQFSSQETCVHNSPECEWVYGSLAGHCGNYIIKPDIPFEEDVPPTATDSFDDGSSEIIQEELPTTETDTSSSDQTFTTTPEAETSIETEVGTDPVFTTKPDEEIPLTETEVKEGDSTTTTDLIKY